MRMKLVPQVTHAHTRFSVFMTFQQFVDMYPPHRLPYLDIHLSVLVYMHHQARGRHSLITLLPMSMCQHSSCIIPLKTMTVLLMQCKNNTMSIFVNIPGSWIMHV